MDTEIHPAGVPLEGYHVVTTIPQPLPKFLVYGLAFIGLWAVLHVLKEGELL